jgi:hypothetical protein
MEEKINSTAKMERVPSALFHACQRARRLQEAVERLEAAYEHEEGPLNPGYFYVPSTELTGRDLEPDWTDHAPPEERRIRKAAIDATLALRRAVDEAIEAVTFVASCMDGLHESVDRRWTTRTIGELRRLRGAVNRGHAPDVVPSALPMIRAGVPETLREASMLVAARMEEVKSAILAGVRTAKDVDPHPEGHAGTRPGEEQAGAFGDPAPQSPPDTHEPAPPSLTLNQSRVLQAMSRFDASLLLSAAVIAEETEDKRACPPLAALSDETTRQCVAKLRTLGLAERSEGPRSGARLTIAGRRLAGKIAD